MSLLMDALNRALHRELLRRGLQMPSMARVGGRLCLRPCFLGARQEAGQEDELLDEVLTVGRQLATPDKER